MKTANLTKQTNSSNTKQLRRMLEEKSTELRAHLKMPSANPMLHASGDPYDSADWADKSHEEWIYLQKSSAEVQALREVQDALDRLRQGTFGICLECEDAISQKRLLAVPWARYCLNCQESLSRDEMLRAA